MCVSCTKKERERDKNQKEESEGLENMCIPPLCCAYSCERVFMWFTYQISTRSKEKERNVKHQLLVAVVEVELPA
jgi:hypothetical protein